MSNIAVCSICSRAKRDDAELLNAMDRYTGSHIAKVAGIAHADHAEFFILSGVYGFINAYQQIPYYDHPLRPQEMSALAETVGAQLEKHGISEVRFYTKQKPSWEPYREAITKAALAKKIQLQVHELDDD